MDKMIEVRYAGVVIGRTAIVRELDTRGLFLGITEPMPVGTPIALRIGDQAVDQAVHGKVEVVSESQELAHAGMRIRFDDPGSAVLFGTPTEAPPEPDPVVLSGRQETEAPTATAPATPSAAGRESVAAASDREDASSDDAAGASPSGQVSSAAGHRRIVVDASTENLETPGMSDPASGDDADQPSTGVGAENDARIPAPDPQAFGAGGGGRKGRRNKRR